jgi:hypothetical protein
LAVGQIVGSAAAAKLGENPLIMMIAGGVIAGFTQVLSYFYGSSKGSSDKNQTLLGARG